MLWFAGIVGVICGIWVLVGASNAWDEYKEKQAALGKEWAIDKFVSEKLLNERSKDAYEAEQLEKNSAEQAKNNQRAEAHALVEAKLKARKADQ